jgi:hypothetical protein
MLTQSLSKIHISFDGWTTKGGKRSFLGLVAHYVSSSGKLIDLPIALPQLLGAHTGDRIAEVVLKSLEEFGITAHNLGYFMLDNAYNNDAAIDQIAQQMGFTASHRRLRCGAHTLNLVGQTLLWGNNAAAYDNTDENLQDEERLLQQWRRDGPLGILIAIINHIKTPQQHELFESFQRLANQELPIHEQKILQPVKPVVTGWNSYFSAFERAV